MSDPVMREDWAALIEVLSMAIEGLDDKKAESVKQNLQEFSSTAAMLGLDDLAAAGVRFQDFLKTDVDHPWIDEAASTLALSIRNLRDSMEANGCDAPFSSGIQELAASLDSCREMEASAPAIEDKKIELPTAWRAESAEEMPAFVMDKAEWYRELLQLDPSSRIFVAFAEELCSRNAWSEAVSVCRQGLTFYPQNLRGRVLLGWALWRSGDLAEAERILQATREDLEKNAILYRILAEVAESRGESEHSAEMMNLYHALSARPDRPVFAAPPEPSEATSVVSQALKEPHGEVGTIPSEIDGEAVEAAIKEPAMEMPAEGVDTPSSGLSIAGFCRFLEQYTRKPPLKSSESILFSQEDREALKKILLCRTA